MAIRSIISALAFLSVFSLMLFSGQVKEAGNTSIRVKNTPATAGEPTYRIKRTTGKIKLDGHLSEDAWNDALVVPINNEFLPGDNIRPEVKTDCLILYDDNSLYIGFKAHDPDVGKIRAHLMDRDKGFLDDNVGIMLDTFNDRNRAYGFFCNPLGIQTDQIFFDGGLGEDIFWDAIWKSRGHITDYGYEVEMAIPFRALQFPRMNNGKEQTWGFAVMRVHPRQNRTRIINFFGDRNNSCFVCQFPKLTGISGVTPGLDIELDPTITAFQTDTRPDFPHGELKKANSEVELGLSGHWGFTSSLTLSATINPDFSQVEADAVQLDINTQYALYLDEKRPFFLEGRDFFTTGINAFYSRTVADPSWGVKVSGKEGKNAVGLFVGRDDSTYLIIPDADFSDDHWMDRGATVSVLRYRRDLGSSSTIGVLATDREGDGYYNRLGGIDGLIRLSASDTIRFQGLGSSTRYPGEVAEEFQQNTGNFNGYAAQLSYRRQTRAYGWRIEYNDYSPGFRADLGFIPKVGYRQGLAHANHTIWGNADSFFPKVDLGVTVSQTYYHKGGGLQESNARLSLYLEMPLQTQLWANSGLRRKVFNGVSFEQAYIDLFTRMKPTASLFLSCRLIYGDDIDYNHTRPGRYLFLQPGISFNPGKHFFSELVYLYSYLHLDEGELFHSHIFQGKLIYHFSKRAFLRGVVQYQDYTRNTGLYMFPVLPESRMLFTQFLFSYKLNPRTVLFLGYTDKALGYTGVDMTRNDRTFFLKVGYALSL